MTMGAEATLTSAGWRAALATGPLALIGCGKMGVAMLEGWLEGGAPADRLLIIEPAPAPALEARAKAAGVRLMSDVAASENPAAVIVLAVKPQMMGAALPTARALCASDTLVLSIAAGLPLSYFEAALPPGAAIVRAMPNTPAAIGRGVSALTATAQASASARTLAEALLKGVGDTFWVDDEGQMDAVTAVSGSGPAYVFHMIEALTRAARAEGLPAAMAERLAVATVGGAAALAVAGDASPETLRRNVTSPAGTTAAGLSVLMGNAMDPDDSALTRLMTETVKAAAARSRALGAP